MAAAASYKLKVISFLGRRTPIVLQDENGPCPLVALSNVLLLRSAIRLHEDQGRVLHTELIQLVVDYLLVQHSKLSQHSESAAISAQTLHDTLALVPKLQHGLDINPKFQSTTAFEFTAELSIFDLANVRLVHGWLVDPQDSALLEAVDRRSYNQLVELVIAAQEPTASPAETARAALVRDFLESTQSQLTVYGLSALQTETAESQLCVLFRNNHFSTLLKRNGQIFTLVTDQGMAVNGDIVWELIATTDGDGTFLTGDFQKYQHSVHSAAAVQPSEEAELALQLGLTISEVRAQKAALAAMSQQLAPATPVPVPVATGNLVPIYQQPRVATVAQMPNGGSPNARGERISSAEAARRERERQDLAYAIRVAKAEETQQRKTPQPQRSDDSDCTIL